MFSVTRKGGGGSGSSGIVGSWDASTNTPALDNTDTGVLNGTRYQVSVAGTHDFGAGNITFDINDNVVWNGASGFWFKDDKTPKASETTNDSSVAGASVSDALDNLEQDIDDSIEAAAGEGLVHNAGVIDVDPDDDTIELIDAIDDSVVTVYNGSRYHTTANNAWGASWGFDGGNFGTHYNETTGAILTSFAVIAYKLSGFFVPDDGDYYIITEGTVPDEIYLLRGAEYHFSIIATIGNKTVWKITLSGGDDQDELVIENGVGAILSFSKENPIKKVVAGKNHFGYLGEYTTTSALETAHPAASNDGKWALIKGSAGGLYDGLYKSISSTWTDMTGNLNELYVALGVLRPKPGTAPNGFRIGSDVEIFTAEGDDITGDFSSKGSNVDHTGTAWQNNLQLGTDFMDSATITKNGGAPSAGINDGNTQVASEASDHTITWKADFSSTTQVDLVHVFSYGPGQNPSYGHPTSIVIEGSDDDVSYTQVNAGSIDAAIVVAGVDVKRNEIDLTGDGFNYRYMKLVITRGTSLVGLTEFEAFEPSRHSTNNTFDYVLSYSGTKSFSPNTLALTDETDSAITGTGKVNIAYNADGGGFGSLVDIQTFKALPPTTFASLTTLALRFQLVDAQQLKTGTIETQGTEILITDGDAALNVDGQEVTSLLRLERREMGKTTYTPTGTTQDIDLSAGSYFVLDLGSATGNVTVTFSNAPTIPKEFLIEIIQGATERTIIWPGTVEFGKFAAELSKVDDGVTLQGFTFNGTTYRASEPDIRD